MIFNYDASNGLSLRLGGVDGLNNPCDFEKFPKIRIDVSNTNLSDALVALDCLRMNNRSEMSTKLRTIEIPNIKLRCIIASRVVLACETECEATFLRLNTIVSLPSESSNAACWVQRSTRWLWLWYNWWRRVCESVCDVSCMRAIIHRPKCFTKRNRNNNNYVRLCYV